MEVIGDLAADGPKFGFNLGSSRVQSCPQIYEWVDQQSDCGWSKDWIQPPHAHKFMTTRGSELEPDSDRSRTAVAGGSELEPDSVLKFVLFIVAFYCIFCLLHFG
ncbi:hypothetical protein QYF36_020082 [Acer negundo]|nr:hypothetical protein QYF36_020082 [Acer negundo]